MSYTRLNAPVYQRGSVINSQPDELRLLGIYSISKGIGDQFSARREAAALARQYIKGDR